MATSRNSPDSRYPTLSELQEMTRKSQLAAAQQRGRTNLQAQGSGDVPLPPAPGVNPAVAYAAEREQIGMGYLEGYGSTALADLERQRVAQYSQAGQNAIGGALSGGVNLMSAAGRGVNQDFARRRIALQESINNQRMSAYGNLSGDRLDAMSQSYQGQQQYGLDRSRLMLQQQQANISAGLDRSRLNLQQQQINNASNLASRTYSSAPKKQTLSSVFIGSPSYQNPGTISSTGFSLNRAYNRING